MHKRSFFTVSVFAGLLGIAFLFFLPFYSLASSDDTGPGPTDSNLQALTPTPSPACGMAWRVVSSPNVGSRSNALDGIDVVSPNDVWAVGFRTDVWELGLVQHWDGSEWSVVSAPQPQRSRLKSVSASSSNDVWAVGYYEEETRRTLIEHWNGTQWSIIPSPNAGTCDNYLQAVTAIAANDVWAVGYSILCDFTSQTLTMHWDGAQWSIIPSPNIGDRSNFLNGVVALSSSDVWAVGSYIVGADGSVPMALHWDGMNWTAISMPQPTGFANTLYGVSASSADDVWAVGYSYNDQGSSRTLTEHWDGTQWSIVPSANVGPGFNRLRSVAALSTSDVWAVGDNYSQTLTEHWDGTEWSIVPSANAGPSLLNAVGVVSANDVWAVGLFSIGGNVSQTLIEHYNDPCITVTPIATGTPTASSTRTRTAVPTSTGTRIVCDAITYAYATSTAVVVPGTTDIGNHCDECYTGISLPFAFRLYTAQFSQVNVHANGNLLFGRAVPSLTCPPSAGVAYIVTPYGTNLRTDCANCGVYTSTTGSAPNRIFNIEWRAQSSPGGVPTNFEVRLYEAVSGLGQPLEFIYGTQLDPLAQPAVAIAESVSVYTCFPNMVVPNLKVNWRLVLTACSTQTPPPSPTPCEISFSDVQPSDYFYEAVRYLYCAGAISGYVDGTFRPYNNTTRAQLSKIVVLAEGWPIDTTGGPHFSDVPTEHNFYDYVETAYNREIVSGYADGTFRPDNNVTRAQLCKVIVLAQEWAIDTTGGPHFSDVTTSHPLYGYIETAYNHVIITGYQDSTFRPDNSATRGQICKIVYQAITRP